MYFSKNASKESLIQHLKKTGSLNAFMLFKKEMKMLNFIIYEEEIQLKNENSLYNLT